MTTRATQTIDRSRRALLTGAQGKLPTPIRPPWTDEGRVIEACTRCDDCIDTCPEGVLKAGQGGFPEFDPHSGAGACTFCGVCAAACTADVFDVSRDVPWRLNLEIESAACLAHAGVHCSSCYDACDDDAILMPARVGGPPLPEGNATRCTGCGACVGSCPGAAISLSVNVEAEAA
ncbi:MAG: ferredoxin-type protein NapF [Rhodospirillales bacterium]|nr:ferredoxin-type protein NapF [Rhodospirillales bacterium]MBO6786592.1 ferredoxin-type protein NapF [Rhodospirillales bacterium]